VSNQYTQNQNQQYMATIKSQIKAWEQKLLLASDPNEMAIATNELKRLKELLNRASLKTKDKKQPGLSAVAATATYNPGNEPVVFIIHGHDVLMKREVQLFINRCGLTDMVGHEEADNGSTTIIEKLEALANRPVYAIALLSPDDVLQDGTMRARQNVIFEIGYFMGKLGRQKMRLLRKPGTAIPSDLEGILYTNYDEEGSWKLKLTKEMRAVGITLNVGEMVDRA
jgi:predicted nucleotide-binding protein